MEFMVKGGRQLGAVVDVGSCYGVSQQLQVTTTYETQYVRAGDDVKLPCNISIFAGQRVFTLAWHHVAQGAPGSLSAPVSKDNLVIDESKYTLKADVRDTIGVSGQYELTVLNISEDDSGQFVCKVQPMRGALRSYVHPVFVGKPPSVSVALADLSHSAMILSNVVHVAEHGSLSLACHDSQGSPIAAVDWFCNAAELPVAMGNGSSVLHLRNVTMLRNGSRCECRAKNVYEVGKLNVQLLVEAKAQVADFWPKDPVHTYPLRTESFRCLHRGSPMPSVHWQFLADGDSVFRPLALHSNKYATRNDSNFSLCIRNVTRLDAGVYRCVLTNRLRVLTPDAEPPKQNFTLTFAPLKPNLIIPNENVFANACFVNWTIMASSIDYYVLYARTVSVYDSQADESRPTSSSSYADYNYDEREQSNWKNDNFSHIINGAVFQPLRHGWKLFEGSRVLTNLLPRTVYQVKLEACYMNSCSESKLVQFQTKDESKPLRSIPFAVTIKQRQTDEVRAARSSNSAASKTKAAPVLLLLLILLR